MCVPNIYVVGFETITQIMWTVAYNTLMEAIIRTKQLKKFDSPTMLYIFHIRSKYMCKIQT
jgi:hypothetical protein